MTVTIETKKGLSFQEVTILKEKYGPNKLPEKAGRSKLSIFITQFKNPLIYIITTAALISLILSEYEDAIIIGIVIFIDTFVGFLQEFRAEKTMEALKGLLKPIARVIREGQVVEIETSEIVPGDLILLNLGDKIAADGIILENTNLSMNESILTGESEPIVKNLEDKVFMGTVVLSGHGLIQVTDIGLNTQLGKIAESLSEIRDETTPLQVRLEKFSKTLTIIVIIICIGIFLTGLLMRKGFLEMIRLAVVLAIAAIPESLLIAVTMILVIGMRVILRRKGLVKKLLAVETLGSVSTICTDKTGTLTEGIMQVVRTDFQNSQYGFYTMALCNNLADALEVSLWNYIKQTQDPQELVKKYPRSFEIPFSSERKYMLTTNLIDGIEIGFLKGAPDIIMNLCNLKENEKKSLTKELEEWASTGLRVLAVAYKKGQNIREISGYTWCGFIGIQDPIRETVKDAITLCRRAGVKVKMITGDYRKTAEQIGFQLGLSISSEQVLEGKELDQMNAEDLAKVIKNIDIFCRVSPHHKMKIVDALQMSGEITAMIGDGVNDAPALKKANIGVAVGNGTDVAKETANLILLDNNFGTLVNAVEEGRTVFDNIKKVVAYVLSNSFAEIFIIFGAFLLGWPTPLTVSQILWIHLICDGPSDIALGFERGEQGIMDQPPKTLEEDVLDNKAKILILAISGISSILCLVLFYIFWQQGDLILGRTIVFAVLGMQSLIYIFSFRSLEHPLIKSGHIFRNKWLLGSVFLGISQIIMGLYVPGLHDALNVVPLEFGDWMIVLGVSFFMIAIAELVKILARKIRGTTIQQVYRIIGQVQRKMPEISNLHNVSVDIMKDKVLLQFHFEVPGEVPLETAHQLVTKFEKEFEKLFPLNLRRNLDIISHIEPAQLPPTKIHSHSFRPIAPEIHQKVADVVMKVSRVKGWDHMNIIEEENSIAVSLTVLFDKNMELSEVHYLTEEIEEAIRKTFEPVKLKRCNIHAEPYLKK